MAVDADNSSPSIDTTRNVSGLSPFTVSFNITKATQAYKGYNLRVKYDDGILAFVPTQDLSGDTVNESWDYTGLGSMSLDSTVSQLDENANTLIDTLFGGSARTSGSTSATGAVVNATFRCVANGSTDLHLVSSAERPTQYTTTLGAGGVAIGTLLSDATINCSSVLTPTPTASPTPPATPTPGPQVCTFADSAVPTRYLTISKLFGGQVEWGWFDNSASAKAIQINEGAWGGVRFLFGNHVMLIGRAIDTHDRRVTVIGFGLCPSGPGHFTAIRLSPFSIMTIVDRG